MTFPANLCPATLHGRMDELLTVYAQTQQFPATIEEAWGAITTLEEEINQCLNERHGPAHPDLPWRFAHLVVLAQMAERAGLEDGSAHLYTQAILSSYGISVQCAVEMAILRLQALCAGQDVEHIDTHVLVPLLKGSLAVSGM